MKYSKDDIGGEIVKQDERYVVKDNTELNNLVISSTALFPFKSTSGHSHEGQEEVYFFISGHGIIYLDYIPTRVGPGDIVTIHDGVHHRVEAMEDGCYFICVFDGNRYDKSVDSSTK